jgi:uncharacterized protein YqgQ
MNNAAITIKKTDISAQMLNNVTIATQLHINKKLYEKGIITEEMYMKAMAIFLKQQNSA